MFEWSRRNICQAFHGEKNLAWEFMRVVDSNPESAFEIWIRLTGCTVPEFICDTIAAYKPLLVPSLISCYKKTLANTPYGAVRQYVDPEDFRRYTGRSPDPGKETYIQMSGLYESDAHATRVLGYFSENQFFPVF